jgi:hypothetical protein
MVASCLERSSSQQQKLKPAWRIWTNYTANRTKKKRVNKMSAGNWCFYPENIQIQQGLLAKQEQYPTALADSPGESFLWGLALLFWSLMPLRLRCRVLSCYCEA